MDASELAGLLDAVKQSGVHVAVTLSISTAGIGVKDLADALDPIRTALAAMEAQEATNGQTLANLKAQLTALGSQTTVDPAAIKALADQINTDTGTLATQDTGAAPPPRPAALAVSPTSVTGTHGTAVSGTLAATGGTPPYTYASSLADLVVDATGAYSGTPANAENGTFTVGDSASPPATVDVSVTIS